MLENKNKKSQIVQKMPQKCEINNFQTVGYKKKWPTQQFLRSYHPYFVSPNPSPHWRNFSKQTHTNFVLMRNLVKRKFEWVSF